MESEKSERHYQKLRVANDNGKNRDISERWQNEMKDTKVIWKDQKWKIKMKDKKTNTKNKNGKMEIKNEK